MEAGSGNNMMGFKIDGTVAWNQGLFVGSGRYCTSWK